MVDSLWNIEPDNTLMEAEMTAITKVGYQLGNSRASAFTTDIKPTYESFL
jgi:hypothetical protein